MRSLKTLEDIKTNLESIGQPLTEEQYTYIVGYLAVNECKVDEALARACNLLMRADGDNVQTKIFVDNAMELLR